MPDLSELRKGLNLEQKVEKQFEDNLKRISTQTPTQIPSSPIGQTPVQQSGGMIGARRIEVDEKTMFENLGSGLWDFGREAGESFVDLALGGIPSAVTDWDPAEGASDSLGGKLGQAVGSAAGFLVPFRYGAQVMRGVGRAFAGQKSATKVAQSITKDIENVLAKKGAIKFGKKGDLADGISKTDDIIQSFKKHVLDPVLINPIKGFDGAFQTVTKRNEFSKQIMDNAYKMIDDLAIQKGFRIDKGVAEKAINSIVKDAWKAVDGVPITSMQSLIAQNLHRIIPFNMMQQGGKVANLYGHLAEEALLFAGVENLMHGVDVLGGMYTGNEVEADFAGTTKHAIMMGHLLGAVRFIPGGTRGGMLPLMRGNGAQRIERILKASKNHSSTIDVTTQKGQQAIFDQYNLLANIKDDAYTGGPISLDLKNFVKKHPLWNRIDDEAASTQTFRDIIMNKSRSKKALQQKEDATIIMRDALRDLNRQVQGQWRKKFVAEFGKDILESTPRMVLGGYTMGGMNEVFLNPNIPFEDKLISFMTGAFLMKHGKELQYKNINGSYEGMQVLGFKAHGEFSNRLLAQEQLMNAFGTSMKNSPEWSNIYIKALIENELPSIARNQTPENLESLQNIHNMVIQGGTGNVGFTTVKSLEVKQKENNQIKNDAQYESIYNEIIHQESTNILRAAHEAEILKSKKERRFKTWGELTKAEKNRFVKSASSEGLMTRLDVYDRFNDANADFINQLRNLLDVNATNLADVFGDVGLYTKIPNSSRIEFRQIRIKLSGEQRKQLDARTEAAIDGYNELVNLITSEGVHTKSSTPWELTGDKFDSGKMQELLATYKQGLGELNGRLKLNEIRQQVDYSTETLTDAFRFLDLHNAIRTAAGPNGLKNIFDTNAEFADVFMDSDTALNVVGNFVVARGRNRDRQLEHQMNAILKTIRQMHSNLDPALGSASTKTITQEQARFVINTLENVGIHAFSGVLKRNSSSLSITEMGKQVAQRYNIERLRNSTKNNGERIDVEDIGVLQALEDFGITKNFTLRSVSRVLFDVKTEGWLDKANTDGIEATIETLKRQGVTENNVGILDVLLSMQKLVERGTLKANEAPGFFDDVLAALQGIIRPYEINPVNSKGEPVRKIDGKDVISGAGVLNRSGGNKYETGITPAKLLELKNHIETIRTEGLTNETQRFINDITESIARTENMTNKRFRLLILNLMGQGSRFNYKSATEVYTLAQELKLYNPKGDKKFADEDWSAETIKEYSEKLINRLNRNFKDENKAIDEVLRNDKFFEKDFPEPKDVKLTDILNKYDFAENSRFKLPPEAGRTTADHVQYMQRILEDVYNKDYDLFIKDFQKDLGKAKIVDRDNAPKEIDIQEATIALSQFIQTKNKQIKVVRYDWNGQENKNVLTSEDLIQEPIVVQILRGAQSEFGKEVNILQGKGINDKGNRQTLSDSGLRNNALENLFQGTYASIDKAFSISDIFKTKEQIDWESVNSFNPDVNANQSFIAFRWGKQEYAYLIKSDKVNLDTIANNYVKMLDARLKANKDVNINRDKLLEEAKIKEVSEGVYEWNIGNDWTLATESMHKVMNDLIYDRIIGQRYWNENMRTFEGKNLNALLKRASLFNNISAVSQTDALIKMHLNALKRKGPRGKYEITFEGKEDVIEVLSDLADTKKRWKQVTVADEVIDGIDVKNSIIKQIREDIKALETENPKLAAKAKEEFDELIDSGKFSDASDVNGITFVSEKVYKALAYLAGETDFTRVGGIKPIILGTGANQQLFVNKTAMVNNPRIKSIFDANQDVAWITFTSASKQIGASREINLLRAEDVLKPGFVIDNAYKQTILPENINIISTKKSKEYATLSINHTSHLNTTESRKAYYLQYVEPKVTRIKQAISDFKDPSKSNWTKAYFKSLMNQRAETRTSLGQEMLSSEGIMSAFARNNVLPTIMTRQWENLIKNNLVDDLFKIKTVGGNAVLSPTDFGVKDIYSGERLKNTLIVDGKIYNFGEAEIPYLDGLKPIDWKNQNVNLIQRVKGNYDKVIDVFDAENSTIKQALEKEGINQNSSLNDLQQAVYKLGNGKGEYQIALAVERNPHTKPSSVMVVGLKGFLSKDMSNQFNLNSVDVKRAAEGDFDIDTVNYWWNSNKNTFSEYVKGREMIQDSQPLPKEDRKPILMNYEGLKNTAKSIQEYMAYEQNAMYLRGSLMNANRIVQYFLSNQTTRKQKFIDGETGKSARIVFEFDEGVNKRYITIRQGASLKKVYQKIADYNQAILDYENGYNRNKFSDKQSIMDDIFFNSKDGFFVQAKLITTRQKVKGKQIETSELIRLENAKIDSKDKEIITKALIRPYEQILKLSNKIYKDGESQNVGWRDLVSQAEEFNYSMNRAHYYANNLNGKKWNSQDIDYFGGFAQDARLTNTSKTSESFMHHDRVLAEIMHMKNIQFRPVGRKDKSETIPFADEIAELTNMPINDMGDAIAQFNSNFKNDARSIQVANEIQNRIDKLKRIRSKQASISGQGNYDSYNYYDRQIKKLVKAKDGILNNLVIFKPGMNKQGFPITNKDYDAIRNARIKSEVFQEKTNLKKDALTKEEFDAVVKRVDKDLQDKGMQIDTVRDSDMINTLALMEGFGFYGYKVGSEIGFSKNEGQYKYIEAKIREIKNDYNAAWQEFFAKDKVKWRTENEIKDWFYNQIDSFLQGLDSQQQTWFMLRLMTPEMDTSKLVNYNGSFFFKPTTTNVEKFINLGLGYMIDSQTNSASMVKFDTMQVDAFVKGIGRSYEYVYNRLHNRETDIKALNEATGKDVEHSFFVEPFEIATGHSKAELVDAFYPGTAIKMRDQMEFSKLDEYSRLQSMFGVGMIRDIITNGKELQLPTHVVTRMSMYGRHMQLNGIEGLRRAQEMDDALFLYQKDKGSIFNTSDTMSGGSYNGVDNLGRQKYGNEQAKPEDVANRHIDELKRNC